MADLKTGTTIGGTLVWTQGNFPLYPTGDTLLYKNFMIYSENNKPQADDNDFVSKAKGGIYTGHTEYTRGISIGGSGTEAGVQGISLYGGTKAGGKPTHGIYFGQVLIHGSTDVVTGGWANYFRLGTSGGWVFQTNDINVASINSNGHASFTTTISRGAPTEPGHLTRKDYVDGLINTTTSNANSRVLRSGDTMTGVLTAPNFISTNLATGPDHVPKLSQVVQKNTTLDYGTF